MCLFLASRRSKLFSYTYRLSTVPLTLETSLFIVVHFQTTYLISYGETKFKEDFVQKSIIKHYIVLGLNIYLNTMYSYVIVSQNVCPSGERKYLMKIKLFKKANCKVIAGPTYA